MKVDDFISELLFDFNRLVIPGFGVLTASANSASVHPAEHSFSPPHKDFSFLANTAIEDDRLLLTKVCTTNGIDEPEARKMVAYFVDEIENALKSKGAFELKGIGKFYFNIEKKLCFDSHPEKNFLLSSFGLPEFISKPVLRPENIPSYSVHPPKQEKKKRRLFWIRF